MHRVLFTAGRKTLLTVDDDNLLKNERDIILYLYEQTKDQKQRKKKERDFI